MNPSQVPKVSIVITTYNAENFILNCIDSAVAQDYPNKNIYIYDDGSTDKTESLIAGLSSCYQDPLPLHRAEEIKYSLSFLYKDVQIIYMRGKNNSGPSKGRNISIANAMHNGSHLFQILDSDDQMYYNKITDLIKPILLNPERVAASYGDYIIQGENGVFKYESKPVYDYIKFFGGDCHIHSGSLWNGLALRSRYPFFYPEDQRVCEDYFMARCILRNSQWIAYHVAKPLTLVRSHRNDSTSSVSKEIWQRDYHKTMMNS